MRAQSDSVLPQSVTDTVWQLAETNVRYELTLTQQFRLPPIVASIIANREIPIEEVRDFLEPTIKAHLPDPHHLLDMDKAVARIVKAINENEKIVIFGDYDVDGATSSSLLKRFFNMIGIDVSVYIPDRIEEGYGLNTDALLELAANGNSLCITVDCGTLSFEPIEAANNKGMNVIVIDHHLSDTELPKAVAIVNPNRLDEDSEYRHLAAVGVAFLVAVAVKSALKEQGYFADKKEPNLIELLDIVALGTVCDVVPLKNINRAFVSQGLKVMKQRNNVGLRALADVAGLDQAPTPYHLGFVLGPRINAGGRVGEASLGSTLLASDDYHQCYTIAQQLDRYNAERKAIESQVLEECIEQIESRNEIPPVIFAKGENWHPGVIGIVASRLKERYHLPSAVISITDGIGKASARSITGIDFGSAIVSANSLGHLLAGGGHAMAAGFSVEESKIDTLHNYLCQRWHNEIADKCTRTLKLDGTLTVAGINAHLAHTLESVGPYGAGNPEPKLLIDQCFIAKVDIIGGSHIRCFIGDYLAGNNAKTIKGMAFKAIDTPLGNALLNAKGKKIQLAVRIKLNRWQGRESAELMIEDMAV